jgi:hypothetical protein
LDGEISPAWHTTFYKLQQAFQNNFLQQIEVKWIIFAAFKIIKSMSVKKLEAHFEFRVYYFTIVRKDPALIAIEMYSTPYSFVKVGDAWENHPSNKNNMAAGLIEAVMLAIEAV